MTKKINIFANLVSFSNIRNIFSGLLLKREYAEGSPSLPYLEAKYFPGVTDRWPLTSSIDWCGEYKKKLA
jgi:hypothetical protein